MADRFPTRKEMAAKIEHEGGLENALYYGITAEDVPEGDDTLAAAWADMKTAWDEFSRKAGPVAEMLGLDW